MPPNYSALIRTFNSESTLARVLAALSRQTMQPDHYVFVDSGSTDQTLACVPPGSKVHKYVGREFNYAQSLNQGLDFVATDYVLVISSHTLLENPQAIEYAISQLDHDRQIGAAYFLPGIAPTMGHELIDKEKFNGFNGLWNTCSMIRLSILQERRFRPEVFAAEDQEWARWYLFEKSGKIARVCGGGMNCCNPQGYPLKKLLNDYVAVAYFANRRLLSWRNVLRLAWCGLKIGKRDGEYGRRYYLNLVFRLAACKVSKPRYKSKYF